jgi:hypothetical protein
MYNKVKQAIDEYDKRTGNVLLGILMSPFILVAIWYLYLVANRL